jgi:hypothetical protein
MYQWPSWKMPEAFIWNTIKSTSLSQFQWTYQFMYVTESYIFQQGVIYRCGQSLDSTRRPWFLSHRSWDVNLTRFSSSCLLYSLRSDSIENTVSNSSFLVVCISVVAETGCHVLFTGHCIAADDFSCLTMLLSCHNMIFSCFLPYSFPVLHYQIMYRGWCSTSLAMNNTHT